MTIEPLFHLKDGSPVHRGDLLHVAPDYLNNAGATCTAEFPGGGCDAVTVRSANGAVPTVPIWALSRNPHPDTVDRQRLANARGVSTSQISRRDLEMFRAGLAAAPPVEQPAHPTEVAPAADARDDELLDDATSPGNGNKAKRRAALIATPPSPTEQPATQAGEVAEIEYGATEFGRIVWPEAVDSEKRLMALIVRLFGNEHQAFTDLETLVNRARHPLAHPTEQSREDAALLDWLREHSCDLRCIDAPTGAGDGDIHWVVIEHYMSAPHEREIGRAYDDDPREAIRAAQAQAKGGA
jgi:hypothetical protein